MTFSFGSFLSRFKKMIAVPHQKITQAYHAVFKSKNPKIDLDAYYYQRHVPQALFGDKTHGLERFNLIGDNWHLLESPKPIALLFGFNAWKLGFTKDYLPEYRTAFFPSKSNHMITAWKLIGLKVKPAAIIVWGKKENFVLSLYAFLRRVPIYRMEDGFIRSASLGAEHATPYSLVLDKTGIYFDATKPSDIENMLNDFSFETAPEMLEQAAYCLKKVTDLEISKYDLVRHPQAKNIAPKIKKRILVIGQVDSDFSIKYGNPDNWNFLKLIKLASEENIGAEILYRPHPETYHGFRETRIKRQHIEAYAQISSPYTPLIDLLHTVDHVYTISSLSGLEALIRGIKTTVVGAPFYAGWGLTDDRVVFKRRHRQLSLKEFFAIAYLKYPRYLANIDSPEEGLLTAIYRIKADKNILEYQKYDLTTCSAHETHTQRFEAIAASDAWIRIFLAPDLKKLPTYAHLVTQFFHKIQWEQIFAKDLSHIYQSTLAYMVCGQIDDLTLLDKFLSKIRPYLYKDVLFSLIADLHHYKPGNYLITHIAWMSATHEPQTHHIAYTAQALKTLERQYLETINPPDTRCGDDAELADQAPKNERISAGMAQEQSHKTDLIQLHLTLLDDAFEHKKFDDFIRHSQKLFLLGHAHLSKLLKIAQICDLQFQFETAYHLADLCEKVDIHYANKKSSTLKNTLLKFDKNHMDDYIIKALRHCVLKPIETENIETMLQEYEATLDVQKFKKIIHASLYLDNCFTLNKAMAYITVGVPKKAIYIVEEIIQKTPEHIDDNCLVIYSKALIADDQFERAYHLITSRLKDVRSAVLYREYIRICILGDRYPEGLEAIKSIKNLRIDMNDIVFIPVYLGNGLIEAGYKCYLQAKFRKVILNYFQERFLISDNLDEIRACDDIIYLSAYGPGDEIRFASLYHEIQMLGHQQLKISCDQRLYPLLTRSYPNIQFIPTARARKFCRQTPLENYHNLPASELKSLMDNHLYDVIENTTKFALIPDMIWQFRKQYRDFNGQPFLKADPEKVALMQSRLNKVDNKKYIGINWRSSLNTSARSNNYLTVEQLFPLFETFKDQVQFVNLQYDHCDQELDIIADQYPNVMLNLRDIDQYNDFESVSALMKNLDLILAPCTAVAELAGALGCPTWLFCNSPEINWRKIDAQGTDVWQNTIKIIGGHDALNKHDLVTHIQHQLALWLKQ